jgi:hypothetical protein
VEAGHPSDKALVACLPACLPAFIPSFSFLSFAFKIKSLIPHSAHLAILNESDLARGSGLEKVQAIREPALASETRIVAIGVATEHDWLGRVALFAENLAFPLELNLLVRVNKEWPRAFGDNLDIVRAPETDLLVVPDLALPCAAAWGGIVRHVLPLPAY